MDTKIELTIDGQEVEGVITHRSASDIDVKITKPYQGVSDGLHIPVFARPYRSFNSELGDETAKYLLESIYHLCTFIHTNLDSLTKQYLKIKKKIEELKTKSMTEQAFKRGRLQLRKLLRKGMIDNIEYQKRLIPIRKEYENFELEKNLIWNIFFEEHFPMSVPVGTRNNVLEIIERNLDKTNINFGTQ